MIVKRHLKQLRRAGSPLLALLLVSSAISCSKKEEEASQPPLALDRLEEDETSPVQAVIFGLKLPVGAVVRASFDNQARFAVRGHLDDVVAWFSKTVQQPRMQIRGKRMVFENVVFPKYPKRSFKVEFEEAVGFTEAFVMEMTEPQVMPAKNEAEGWEHAGRNPDGSPRNWKTID